MNKDNDWQSKIEYVTSVERELIEKCFDRDRSLRVCDIEILDNDTTQPAYQRRKIILTLISSDQDKFYAELLYTPDKSITVEGLEYK